MRASAVIIQPSRFEGWSTSVQDAKALGRPLICSDISVHREQAPEAKGFFSPDDSQELADLLSAFWPQALPGPDAAVERVALTNEKASPPNMGSACCRSAGKPRSNPVDTSYWSGVPPE